MTNIKNILFFILFYFFCSNNFAQTAYFECDKEPNNYCMNDTVKFINNSTGNIINQIWFFGDGYETYAENPMHIYQNSGTFTVSLTVFDNIGNSDIYEENITVNLLPELNINPNNDTIIISGQTLTITASGNYDEILWSSGETENEIIVISENVYSAYVSDNTTSCTNTDSINVKVTSTNNNNGNDFEIKTLNNIITPNNDGINDYLLINNLDKFETPCEIFIYDISGRLIYHEQNYKNNWNGTSTNNKRIETGTYYYILKTKNKIGGTGFIDIIF